MNASVTGAVFFMAQFLQVSLGQDPLGAGLRLLPWGVAPFLIAPYSGRLARTEIGARPLVVSGLLLQAARARLDRRHRQPPDGRYPAILAPLIISGTGLALALPAVTKAVVGSVPPGDIGKASGVFSTMRQLGGAFGIAILAAVFAAAGSYASPPAFSDGFATAAAAAAGLALAGALAGLALPEAGVTRHRAAPAQGAPAQAAPVGRRAGGELGQGSSGQ